MDISGLSLSQKREELVSAKIRRDREQRLVDALETAIKQEEGKSIQPPATAA